MFSGKSSMLCTIAEKYGAYSAYKPCIDNRYSKRHIATHDGKKINSKSIYSVDEVYLASQKLIILDEIQFFDGNIVKGNIIHLLQNLTLSGKFVIMSGLDRDYNGNWFETSKKLSEKVDEVFYLKGVCEQCGNPSDRTFKYTKTDSNISIGGPQSYEGRCLSCFNQALLR